MLASGSPVTLQWPPWLCACAVLSLLQPWDLALGPALWVRQPLGVCEVGVLSALPAGRLMGILPALGRDMLRGCVAAARGEAVIQA